MVLIAVFSGCGTIPLNNLPEGYSGETALITDSIRNINQYRSAHFFVLSKIDETAISTSVHSSIRTGYYSGYVLPVEKSRKVKAAKQKFTIAAMNKAGAPAWEMFSGAEYATGEVIFTPRPFKSYIVAGVVNNHYAAVWIEDDMNQRVTEIVESFDEKYQTKEQQFEVRSRYINGFNRKPSAKLSKVEYFNAIKSGTVGADEVIRKLGSPIETTKGNWGFDYQDLTFENLGTLRFVDSKDSDLLTVSGPIVSSANTFSKEKIEEQLNTTAAAQILSHAKKYYQAVIGQESSLDVIAKKIWLERYSDNQEMHDAVGWLCKVLAKSGNGRYREILTKLTEDLKVPNTIRSYFEKSIGNLPEGSATPFRL
jgi:lambda repressor-like predicted transcriptional regulator